MIVQQRTRQAILHGQTPAAPTRALYGSSVRYQLQARRLTLGVAMPAGISRSSVAASNRAQAAAASVGAGHGASSSRPRM